MPELPEVQSVLSSVRPHLQGRRLVEPRLARTDIVTGDRSPEALLHNQAVMSLERKGKQLCLVASTGRCLVVQLGMTGQLLIQPQAAPLAPHVHAVWQVQGTTLSLWFKDPRRFGGLTTFPSVHDRDRSWSFLGPDALTVTAGDLHRALHTSTRTIKAALLDQRITAGVGNIYADESLFVSGLSPLARCRRLRPRDFERLAEAIRQVLAQAVRAGGSTLRDYVDANGAPGTYAARHAVYGRAAEPCTRCGVPLRHATIAQRSTVWCPRCQSVPGSRRVSSSSSL